MVADKGVRTKSYGQNGVAYGQNGNGPKWYGQNGMVFID